MKPHDAFPGTPFDHKHRCAQQQPIRFRAIWISEVYLIDGVTYCNDRDRGESLTAVVEETTDEPRVVTRQENSLIVERAQSDAECTAASA